MKEDLAKSALSSDSQNSSNSNDDGNGLLNRFGKLDAPDLNKFKAAS